MGGGPIKRRHSVELVMIREGNGYISMGMPLDVDPSNSVWTRSTGDDVLSYGGPVKICPGNGLAMVLRGVMPRTHMLYRVRVDLAPISSSKIRR